MKPLMLIRPVRPAQAEALFDAREETASERFPAPPWLDDDGPEENSPPAKAPPNGSDEAARRYPLPRRRAA